GERHRVRDQAAQAEAEQVGLGDAQAIKQRDHVTGQRVDRHRTVGVGGVPMALELDRYHVPARRERAEQRPEVRVDGQQTAVQQYERPPAAVYLVVEVYAVHG